MLTLAGKQAYLLSLFNGTPLVLYAGLCTVVPNDSTTLADIVEPTVGVNGYARIALAVNSTDFPTSGLVNGEPYMDSKDLVWAASGGNFDQSISRVFLTPEITATVGDIYAFSSPIMTPELITPATLAEDRTFNFRSVMR